MASRNDEISKAMEHVRGLLRFVGEDPAREGLKDTPARVVRAYAEWFGGYEKDPAKILKCFADGAEGCDQMVIQKHIPLWSHCEHHMAPFFGVAHVAYIPDEKIVGLSKLTRLVDCFARRLQVQERLTNEVANALDVHLSPKGVGVVLVCRHTCIESRGVCKSGSETVTSALRGRILEDASARNEFLNIVHV
jgi:GTP cyclohydrolase I